MAYLDRQIIALLVPSLKADLNLSDTQVSLLQGIAFSSIFALAGLPLGRLSDRTIRRNVIAGGLLAWTVATIACGVATNFWQLFAARMCVGMGEACLAPATVSILADYFRPAQRGRAMGLVNAGTPIGSGMALILGGFLLTWLNEGGLARVVPADWAPWKSVFIIVGLPGLVVTALAFSLREPPRREQAAHVAAGDLQRQAFLPYLSANLPTFATLYGLYACVFIIGYGVSSWGPTILMRIYELKPAHAGAIYGSILLFCSSTAGITCGFLSDAFARRWPINGRIRIPMLLFPIEIVLLSTFAFSSHLPLTLTVLCITHFTTAMAGASSYAALQELVPSALRGQVIALYLLVANLIGLGCGPTLVALVNDYAFRDEMMLQKSVAAVGLCRCLDSAHARIQGAGPLPEHAIENLRRHTAAGQ